VKISSPRGIRNFQATPRPRSESAKFSHIIAITNVSLPAPSAASVQFRETLFGCGRAREVLEKPFSIWHG